VRRTILAIAAALAVLAVPATASAATIVVNSTAGASTPGVCTLREAILSANNDLGFASCAAGSGEDRIEFALPNPSTINLAAELPAITSGIEIAGPGAGALTVSGSHAVRPFNVEFTPEPVTITGLTIADGKAKFGGGLKSSAETLRLVGVVVSGNEAVEEGGAAAFGAGGGIYTQGDLQVVNSTITGNVARSANASTEKNVAGGGIWVASAAELLLESSTVSGNQAIAATTVGPAVGKSLGNGGGIWTFGALRIVRSTVSGNTVSASGGSSENVARGGGVSIVNDPSVPVVVERSTITGNSATASGSGTQPIGGGVYGFGALQILGATIAGNSAAEGANIRIGSTTKFRDTIVAAPVGGPSCSVGGLVESLGFNLDEGVSCLFMNPTDLLNVNPLLGPLAPNGGPTATMALLHGSPAIDHGISVAGDTTDQRGFARPVEIAAVANGAGSNGADIGAYEAQIPRAEISSGPHEGETISDPEPSFAFGVAEPGATFTCSLDGAAAAACTSPLKTPRLGDGRHTLEIVAIGQAGYAQEGGATSRSFTVDTRKPEPPKGGGGGGKARRPKSRISHLPKVTTDRQPRIYFTSDVRPSIFKCKLDKRKWRRCQSPYVPPKLELGKHVFKLRAIGPTGLADKTPAVRKFKVIKPKRRG
jgi:hypothetical protein